MKEFRIKNNETNQRLDKYLKKLLPNAANSFLYKMLRKKNITLNGKKASGSEALSEGDVVKIFFSDETFDKFATDEISLQRQFKSLEALKMNGLTVIHEDKDILIANKPADMLSQKASDTDISANEYLLGYLIRSHAISFEDYKTFRPSVCNRLDRNTTGLLLMGKTLKGSQELSQMLRERIVQKFYYAIVAGKAGKEEHLKGYLVKDNAINKVQIYDENKIDNLIETNNLIKTDNLIKLDHLMETADFIEMAYKPLCGNDLCTLLEVHLITGKTHQIRAQLASIGHPVIGDLKYGDEAVNAQFRKRYNVSHQLLHAKRVILNETEYNAPVPQIFDRIIGDM